MLSKQTQKMCNIIPQKYSHPNRENTTEEEYTFLKELNDWLKNKLIYKP